MTERAHRLAVLFTAVAAIPLIARGSATVVPSDCLPANIDSTCAGHVSGPTAPPPIPNQVLYVGPLAMGPFKGNEYWGWDYATAQQRTRDDQVPLAFVNRSSHVLTLTFSTDSLDQSTCATNCVPGYEFKIGNKPRSQYPKAVVRNGTASVTVTVPAGSPYAWIIGQNNAPQIQVQITASAGDVTSLSEIGLPEGLADAETIPAQALSCLCWDNTYASCSFGTRFRNGLIGLWDKMIDGPEPPGKFNDCPPER